MFGRSRATEEGLQAIAAAVKTLHDYIGASAQDVEAVRILKDRVADLELSRAKGQAEIEAEVMKAKGKYQAASNAESRARTQAAHYEKNADAGAPDLREESEEDRLERLYWADVEASQANGLPDVPLPVETRRPSKRSALRMKYS